MTTEGQTRSGRRGPSRTLVLPQTLTVKHLSELIDQSPVDVIKQLMRNGIMVSMNQMIDHEVASLVTAAYGIRTRVAEEVSETGSLDSTTLGASSSQDDPANLAERPPVVTISGACRSRQNQPSRFHPERPRCRPGNRWNYPAHRRLPGCARRKEDYLPGYTRP